MARRAYKIGCDRVCDPRPAPDVIASVLLLEADGDVRADIRIVPVDDRGLCGASMSEGFKLTGAQAAPVLLGLHLPPVL